MIRRVVSRALVCFSVASAATPAFALTSRRDGSAPAAAVAGVIAKDPGAYRNHRAWVEKAQTAREARALAASRPGLAPVATPLPSQLAVTGTMNVPVLLGYTQASAPVSPITQAQMQAQLFDSNPTGSVTDYYSEVSYGQFTIDGDVYPWTDLLFSHTYYAGSTQGLVPGAAFTGELIEELLDANDTSIDFGQYDNDGPDGVPNSGDDDGFVDVLCVVHSFEGAECGIATNIQSHAWVYSAWPNSGGAPYTTDDARFGGGFIMIDDYNITPALSCASPPNTIIEIGVLCHELGHGLGLPDLYGINPITGATTGDKGAGDWSLMATGNWNTPDTPAHVDPWCKKELGWLVPTPVDWQATPSNIPAIESNATAFMLPFTDERFRRSASCVIAGVYSLHCGLTQAEATTRGWTHATGGGYGSNWYQTIERDFTYSGTGPVTFQFTCTYDVEPGYDFAYAMIEVNGTESVLLTHTGSGGGTANVPLAAALAPLSGAGGTYTLKFRVTSDFSFDDTDGQNPTTCGAFVVDDVTVTGGGESYASDFESNVGGWHQDPAENPVSEYWLVENRRRVGFDQGLHEQGLLIWHVDDEVMHAWAQVNNAVLTDVRGLVLEEADGEFDLNIGVASNTGEAADVFPGPLAKTSFSSATAPGSGDNTGRTTQIAVTSIGGAAPTMTATLRAGDPAPTAASATPDNIDNDQVAVVVDVAGTRIRHGATFRFVKSGGLSTNDTRDSEDIVATSLEWVDPALLRGTVNVYSKEPGAWDLIVTNPDGQEVTLANAATINLIVATKLVSAAIDVAAGGVRLRYELIGREEGEELRLYRSTRADAAWVEIAVLPASSSDFYEYLDEDVEAGRTYYYLLESVIDGEARELHRGVAVVPARELVLEQNHPNPFNPRTAIRFYLPERGPVELDVYDVRGALVRRLARGEFDSGPHAVDWDGTDVHGQPVASGMYVYRLVTNQRALSKKMMLLK
ncbi:MAG: M6 family metalloprotease domain-containing protein [Candidatus Latescibacteria bacterium]|nr:M6 family metalloprotease domain-containing protein [Candidatus Latescibacterota bacterium]